MEEKKTGNSQISHISKEFSYKTYQLTRFFPENMVNLNKEGPVRDFYLYYMCTFTHNLKFTLKQGTLCLIITPRISKTADLELVI